MLFYCDVWGLKNVRFFFLQDPLPLQKSNGSAISLVSILSYQFLPNVGEKEAVLIAEQEPSVY